MPSTKSKGGTPTYVYVPESFDPNAHLRDDLRRYADCARYLLHRIIWGGVMRRLTLDQFVPLKFDYLRAVIPDRVIKRLKRALIDGGVVECDGQYIEGEKSLGYRLLKPHSEARIVQTCLCDAATAEKVRANRRAEFKRVRLDVHRHLRDWYRCLEIDLPLALDLLKGDPNYEVNKIPPQQIAAKDWSFSVCRYGRVHTDLTRCPKAVRPALLVGGEPLIEIDIANSQPLFLALLLINHRKQGNTTFAYVTFPEDRANPYGQIDEIISRTIQHFSQVEEKNTPPHPTASITTRMRRGEETEDTKDTTFPTTRLCSGSHGAYQEYLKHDEIAFLHLCEGGQLYEHFMDRMEVPVRTWVKEAFFGVIYGDNRHRSGLKTDFKEIFPNVAEVVSAHKRKDHAFLPRLMQSIESNFVVNTVCRRLMNEAPDAPLLTIHDCLLTPPTFVGTVSRVLREEFRRLGLKPTLHVRSYGPNVLTGN